MSCKGYHRWLHAKLVDPLALYGHQDQCGGLRHRGADTAAHYSRSHWEWTAATTANGSQLFVDQKAAFAPACRWMAFQEHISDDQVANLFRRLGIATTVQEFACLLSEPASGQVGMPDRHVVAISAADQGS